MRRAFGSRDSRTLSMRDDERERADRDVHEEHPAPAERVGDDSAEERPGRDGESDRRAPDCDRAGALGPGVLRADQRERRCEQRGAADALERACDVERQDVPRDAAQERGDAEDDDADREDEPAPVAVGERAGREDERGERHRVRVDDPLQARQARVQLRLNARQRDIHDRDVDEQHERRRANGDERPAACGCGPLHPSDAREVKRGGGRDLNPRPPGPQPGALPTELPPPRVGHGTGVSADPGPGPAERDQVPNSVRRLSSLADPRGCPRRTPR